MQTYYIWHRARKGESFLKGARNETRVKKGYQANETLDAGSMDNVSFFAFILFIYLTFKVMDL